MASQVTHFTHQIPGHYLTLSPTDTFNCGACKERGSGSGYKCSLCGFTIHSCCATMGYGQVITFSLHPSHALVLFTEHSHRSMGAVSCDICGDRIFGMWYRCSACNFDVHPLCAQIPQFITAPVHPMHQLRLAAGNLGWCGVCKGSCREWHYRCDGCNFDSHVYCLDGAPGSGDARRLRKRDVVGRLVRGIGSGMLHEILKGAVNWFLQ